jgi:methionine synthase II (cobalamin-independent)
MFISFPTHHTKFVANQENRSKSYIDNCFYIAEDKIQDDETLKILDLIAKKNIVLNTGHISGIENYNLVNYAIKAGIKKILIPANNLNDEEIINLKNLDVMFEFSYFFISKATQIPLTHVDSEKHTINKLEINKLKEFIKIVSCEKVILSSDCGVSVLPKPHLGFKNFISLIKDLGFSTNDIKKMISTNSKNLFNI